VIRPDGYIALRGRPPELEALRLHLDRVLTRVDPADRTGGELIEHAAPTAS
jgi:hypothetical protein